MDSPSCRLTSMDYDDSDFQSQNFQLAGEDNNKFPSSLRPFALPKFDIDEQLQGHLRFDNLIESEVFFGVQGHDNNWIEGLSTGSSVVEFSSSAAESCSISRTNNVWSEATSTESVEMLLKSMGENETTPNMDMDGSAENQLNGMNSKVDPLNAKDKSSNSPTANINIASPNKSSAPSRDALSGLTEDASRTRPQLENIVASSMDEKAEQVVGSNLSDRKSNSMVKFVADKCIVREKMCSTSNNTSESCLAVEHFEVVQDDNPLENLEVKESLAEVVSRKVNNQLFSEQNQMVQLRNMYTTDSYCLGPDDEQKARAVTSEVAEMRCTDERKVKGDLPELKGLSCTGRPLDTTKLLGEVSSETLLSESSDGLLEAITNPVKVLHRNDNTCKRVGLCVAEASYSHVEDSANILKNGSNEHVIKHYGIDEQVKYGGYHQPEYHSSDSNPHLVTSLSTENSDLLQSGEEKELAYVTDVPAKTKNTGDEDVNVGVDENLKYGVMARHPDFYDPVNNGLEEERDVKKNTAGLGNFPLQNSGQAAKGGNDENAKGTADISGAAPHSLEGVVAQDSSAALLNEKGGAVPAVQKEPTDHRLVSPCISVSQGEDAALSVHSSSDTVSLIVPDTVTKKTECIEQVTSNSLATSDTQNKLAGFGSPTKEAEIPSVKKSGAHLHRFLSDTPATQYAHHTDVALSSASLGGSSDKTLQKEADSSVDAKETALDRSAENPRISSRSNVDTFSVGSASGEASYTEASRGSCAVISCREPCPEEGGEGSKALLDYTVRAKSDEPKGPLASADTVQSSKGYSSSAVKASIQSSKETATARDDKSFSFEVRALPSLPEASIQSSKETATARDDKSFSFEVRAFPVSPEKAHDPDWKPFTCTKSAQSTGASIENPQGGSTPGSSVKNMSEDGKKESVKGADKEPVLDKQVVESDCTLCVNSSTAKSTPLEERQQHPTPESSTLARQSFTDLQHVQLRAQIFVYGAVIQGIPPMEAYMVSAFGEPVGGGKPSWEALWRAAVERFQNQKSPLTGLETPAGARFGSWAEQGSKDAAAKNASASRFGSKVAPSVRPVIPLHSPTVDMPSLGSSASNLTRGTHLDFSQVVSPVFTYHSPHVRLPASNVVPWFPQNPSPRPAPWLVSQQNLIFDSSAQLPAVPSTEATKTMPSKSLSISVSPQSLIFDSSAPLPAVPSTETIKVTPSKSLAISHATNTQLVSPGTFLPNQGTPSAALVIQDDKQKVSASTTKSAATSQKSRKRKKASASSEQQPANTVPQLQMEPAPVTHAAKHSAVPSAFTLSTNSPSNVSGSGLVPSTAKIVSAPNYQIVGGRDAEQRVIFLEGALEQSKGQAGVAALHAVEALRHSQGIWSQLPAYAINRLPSEVEEKLSSAAAAAAAAASVANASAEAAKMASEAALQAKMMADEALNSFKSLNSLQKHETGKLEVRRHAENAAKLTPATTLKVKDKTYRSSSIVSVAREVARKRVEEASAAAKRAENLDAILKAAELAAEAVSQAGTIIAMGDPLPFTLSELLEAGPEGYWKSDRARSKKPINNNNIHITASLDVDAADDFNNCGKKDDNKTKHLQAREKFTEVSKELLQLEGVHSGNEVEDVPATAPLNSNSNDTALRGTIWSSIQKGSLVEVLADEGSSPGVWFSAKILDIKDSSLHISYNDCNEGTGIRKEWVALDCEGDRVPRIRVAHPVTASKFEGTRKRRRDIAGNSSWFIGDHVDAWINDSWREGVISEKCDGDETKFVVQFPAGGDPLAVNVWNLRPSLVWKDGQWTEWSRLQDRKNKSSKGDSPYEKRQRTGLLQAAGGPATASGEAGGPYMSNNHVDNPTQLGEVASLALSQGDMIFNAGKDVIKENKADALRVKRSGLQRDGSRVVFGIPRPGKKRKFMEVSKHYVADQVEKVTEGNASAKFAKYLMPQAPRLREDALKVDLKGRRAGDMKSRGLKSAKSQNIVVKNAVGKEPLSMGVPNSVALEGSFVAANTGTSFDGENSVLEKTNFVPDAPLRTEGASVSESRIQAASGVSTSKKHLSTNGARAKRKLAPAKDDMNRNESKAFENPEKTNSDSVEPRRSNRRIQPTSRLLEGLQSSLIISKVPGEKGARGLHRSASSSRGRAHG